MSFHSGQFSAIVTSQSFVRANKNNVKNMPLRNRFCTSDACCADAICSADGSRPLSDFNIQHYYILWLQRNLILCELPTAVHTTGILYFADVHRILVWLWCRAWTPNREKQFRWVVSAGETNCIFRGIWEAWEHERNWRALATCNNIIVQKKNLTVAMASLLTFDSVDVLWRYYWGKRHTKQVETSRQNAMHVARAVSLAC